VVAKKVKKFLAAKCACNELVVKRAKQKRFRDFYIQTVDLHSFSRPVVDCITASISCNMAQPGQWIQDCHLGFYRDTTWICIYYSA
jgi:hypothetical protein